MIFERLPRKMIPLSNSKSLTLHEGEMLSESSLRQIRRLRDELNTHRIYQAVQSLDDLRVFMAHHVYAVWDFMSLLKFLQQELAPLRQPWTPGTNTAVRRFINEIVLEEESDRGPSGPDGQSTYMSHFELYTQGMVEIGADPLPVTRFANLAAEQGIARALDTSTNVPRTAAAFMRTTFSLIDSSKPHVVGAAFAFGREQVIPEMFRSLLARIGIAESQASAFHYYLQRHIHLDEGQHGPLAMLMLEQLIGEDTERQMEAEQAALKAIQTRITFWDGVVEAIQSPHADRRLAS